MIARTWTVSLPCILACISYIFLKSWLFSHAAGFQAIKQLQAQYGVLIDAGPIEQVSRCLSKKSCLLRRQAQLAAVQVAYAIWQQSLLQASQQAPSPHSASDTVLWGSFVTSKMLRHPHPGQTITRWSHCIQVCITCPTLHQSKSCCGQRLVGQCDGPICSSGQINSMQWAPVHST